jgi:hypothetical protein
MMLINCILKRHKKVLNKAQETTSCQVTEKSMIGLNTQLKLLLMGLMALISVTVSADDYSAGWGPAVGANIPVLEAQDQAGELRNLSALTGEQGLLLFLSRSADW